MDKKPNNLLAIGLLALLAVFAAGIAHWSMSANVGVTPDSMVYLSAADRLVEGKGLTPIGYHFSPNIPSGQRLVIFPPAYPVLLASTSLFTSDRLAGAKYIHSFLFAASVFLLGLIIYISSRSFFPALCAMGLFQTSFPLLSTYTMVRAEPLFVFFLLSTLLALVFYSRRARLLLLVACGITTAGAIMTRYVGMIILLPLVLTVFIQSGPLRQRARRGVLVAVIALLPLAGWIIHNRLVAGSSTARSLAFHLIGVVEVKTFIDSLMLLVTPHALPEVVKVLLVTIAAIVVVYSLWMRLRGQAGPANLYIRFFSAVIVATYVIFLAAYNSFANPAVDLGPRVALPVYIFGVIFVFSLVEWESATGKRRTLFWCVVISGSVLFMANVRPAAYWLSYRHHEGEGFTSRAWRDSETVKFLKALPAPVSVSSNAADACYLFTNREVSRIPAKYDPTSARVNTDFGAQMEALRDDLNNNHALVIYFDRVNWRWYLPSRSELEETYKLPVLMRFADGVVFGALPDTFQHVKPE